MEEILKAMEEYCESIRTWILIFRQEKDYDKKKQIARDIEDEARHIETQVSYLRRAIEQMLLKPCPFCHGTAELYMCDGGDYGDDYPEIECTKCGCTMTFEEGTTKEEAIKKWNTRR